MSNLVAKGMRLRRTCLTLTVAARHEAPVAQLRPRRRLRVADAAAANRRIVHLRAQLLHDARCCGLFECSRSLDRNSGNAGILKREPAQIRRLARRVLCLGET